jgi:hypothetical protein
MSGLDPRWLDRLQVVGKAQARYLWVLLVTMIFYAALQQRARAGFDETSLKVPIVDLEVSGTVVLGFGPALISFLVLVILGTMRAYTRAREQLGLGRADWSGEEIDTSPNAMDFAFYTTRATSKAVATVLHFPYTAFLLAGLVEAAWIAKQLVDACAPARWMFVVAGAVFWLPAAWLVSRLVYRRVRDVPTLWRTK